MCGRFSLIDGTATIEKRFGGRMISAEFETFYNAAPSMILPIVVNNMRPGAGKEIIRAKWGLTVPWAPDFRPQPNARLDTVKTKKMFRDAFERRHCLVPANSFFEWRREKGIRQPYRILVEDGALFAMAGIWEPAQFPEDAPSFTILTTEANSMMSKIHDRMPVILSQGDESMWLTEVGSGIFSNIPTQYPSERMHMYPVSTKINRVSYGGPDALTPISEPSLGI